MASSAIPAAAPAAERPDLAIPGRALFVSARGELRAFANDQTSVLKTPYPVWAYYARLEPSAKAVALLDGPSGEIDLWSEATQKLTPLPVRRVSGSYADWSPSAKRVVVNASFGAGEVFVADVSGETFHASIDAALMHVAAWRTDDELTLLTGTPGQNFPLKDMTLWSWRPPADPVQMARGITLTTYPAWSPDGRTFAAIEESAQGRIVRVRGAVERTLLNERDVAAMVTGCSATAMQIFSLAWSPDGQTLVVFGHGPSFFAYFAAFVNVDSGKVALFAPPIAAYDCYMPGHADWSNDTAVIPVFGPDCGLSDPVLPNAVALVDPTTARARAYLPITRKGYLRTAGRYAAYASGTEAQPATTFVSLDDPTARRTIPLAYLADFRSGP